MMSCCGSAKTISFSCRSRTIQGMTPTSSNRAARPTPEDHQAGDEHQAARPGPCGRAGSPRRSEPRQAQRLPPSSERTSSANRQGGRHPSGRSAGRPRRRCVSGGADRSVPGADDDAGRGSVRSTSGGCLTADRPGPAAAACR